MGFFVAKPEPGSAGESAASALSRLCGNSPIGAPQGGTILSAKYWDADTKTYAYQLRDYSPGMGRWLSRDPIGTASGVNLYGFCLNDSSDFVDFLGLKATSSLNSLERECSCCCAADIALAPVNPPLSTLWDSQPRNGNFPPSIAMFVGHKFDALATTTASDSEPGDCLLVVREEVLLPPSTIGAQSGSTFIDPGQHNYPKIVKIPPGGSYNLSDFPRLWVQVWAGGKPYPRTGRRKLEIALTLTSAPDCSCTIHEVKLLIIQDISVEAGAVTSQSFNAAATRK